MTSVLPCVLCGNSIGAKTKGTKLEMKIGSTRSLVVLASGQRFVLAVAQERRLPLPFVSSRACWVRATYVSGSTNSSVKVRDPSFQAFDLDYTPLGDPLYRSHIERLIFLTTPSEFLKSSTQSEHQNTELAAGMQRLVAADLERDEFARIQSQFFGVFAPLEQTIAIDPLWDSVELSRPERTIALQSDLLDLGVDLAAVPRADVTPVDDLAQQLGRIYVLEGSRLGGRFIRKALSARQWYQDNANGRFFADSEPDRWQRIKQWLDNSLTDQSLLDTATSSAINTFSSVRQWMNDDE